MSYHKRGRQRLDFEPPLRETRGGATVPPPANTMGVQARGPPAIPKHILLEERSKNPGASLSYMPKPFQAGVGSGGHSASSSQFTKRRMKDDDAYFDADGEAVPPEDINDLEYIPAPGSPALEPSVDDADYSLKRKAAQNDEEEEDPLDAFMADLESSEKKDKDTIKTKQSKTKTAAVGPPKKAERLDIGPDEQEQFFSYMESNPSAGLWTTEAGAEAAESHKFIIGYDSKDNPIYNDKKSIECLPPIDHSSIAYKPFRKNFYHEHPDISALEATQLSGLRRKLDITVSGVNPPKPVSSFGHFNFEGTLLNTIRKLEFTRPTAIQAQAVPAALSGRDVIGIAQTGSGKTLAYVWPLLVHVLDQPPLQPGDGPMALVIAPTRELALQIHKEIVRFATPYNLAVVCAYGGGNMWEQQKALEAGADIVVCTPGRMIDLVRGQAGRRTQAVSLSRVSFLVIDECDKMFDLGFEPQVRSLANNIRPDRQTLFFSATFKRKVERLAREILTDPVKIVQGRIGEANEDILQICLLFASLNEKYAWLKNSIVRLASDGQVIVFASKRQDCEDLSSSLTTGGLGSGVNPGVIHGDLHQSSRNDVISRFKKGEINVLIATDVAARGLDIPAVRTVINYDLAKDTDTHIHRIGRTGRAGTKGTAYSLVQTDRPSDREFAPHLVKHLEAQPDSHQPEGLLEIAMTVPWFMAQRQRSQAISEMGLSTGFKGTPSGIKMPPPSASHASSSLVGGPMSMKVRSTVGHSSTTAPSSSSTEPPQTSGVAESPEDSAVVEESKSKSAPSQPPPGPTNRLDTLRQAFGSSFRTGFTPASSHETAWKNTITPEEVAMEMSRSRKKKSRWD